MSLPPRVDLTDWSAEIGRASRDTRTATAKFYDSTKVLKHTAQVRVQHLRAPLDSSSATAWATKRVVRLQEDIDDSSPFIPKGWIVQLSPGVDRRTGAAIPLKDPSLAKISLTVQSAINSSAAALRTVECISELTETPRA